MAQSYPSIQGRNARRRLLAAIFAEDIRLYKVQVKDGCEIKMGKTLAGGIESLASRCLVNKVELVSCEEVREMPV